MIPFNNWQYSPMEVEVTPRRRRNTNKSRMMNVYGRTSEEGKWHLLNGGGFARCSTGLTIRQKKNLLGPPKNLCERCAMQKKVGNLAKKASDQTTPAAQPRSFHLYQPAQPPPEPKLVEKEGNMRKDLWLRYYGSITAHGWCFTCHSQIGYAQYKPGKVYSGGVNCFTNNRPLCLPCHTKMGDNGMDEFKAERFPDRLKSNFQPIEIEWEDDYIIKEASVQMATRRSNAWFTMRNNNVMTASDFSRLF